MLWVPIRLRGAGDATLVEHAAAFAEQDEAARVCWS